MSSTFQRLEADWQVVTMQASSCSFLHFTLHDVRCSDLTPDGVGVQWSLCLFITCLPFETALRVWDVFFYDGAPALSRVALALFKLAEPAVASSTNAIQALQALQVSQHFPSDRP